MDKWEGRKNRWVGGSAGTWITSRWTYVHSWEDFELDGHDSPLCLRFLTSLLLS